MITHRQGRVEKRHGRVAHQNQVRNDFRIAHDRVLNFERGTTVSYYHTAVWCLAKLRLQPASEKRDRN